MVGLIGGIAGGVLGSAIGIAGAWLGIRASVKNTRGPRERAFVVQSAIRLGILTCAFVAGMLLLSTPWKIALGSLYVILLFTFIIRTNRRQAEIRLSESPLISDRESKGLDDEPKL
jgi:protein-S-isoprenylcysteine O-methyltransferase Ste14